MPAVAAEAEGAAGAMETDLEGKLKSLVASEDIPLAHIRELTSAEGYPVLTARRATTRYGKAIALTIGGAPGTTTPGNDGRRLTFLPRRFEARLSDDDLAELERVPGSYKVRCTKPSSQSPEVMIYRTM